MMARTLGIPARVAVGFLEPDRQPDGSCVYSSHDMHAWPELYFEGAGWMRFEPTPADQARTRADVHPGPGARPAARSRPSDPSAPDFNEAIKPTHGRQAGQTRRPAGHGRLAHRRGTSPAVVLLLVGAAARATAAACARPAVVASASVATRRSDCRSTSPRAPGPRCARPRSTSVSAGTTARRCAVGPVPCAASLDGRPSGRQPAPVRRSSGWCCSWSGRATRARGSPPSAAAEVLSRPTRCWPSLRAARDCRRRDAAPTWLPASLWQSRQAHGADAPRHRATGLRGRRCRPTSSSQLVGLTGGGSGRSVGSLLAAAAPALLEALHHRAVLRGLRRLAAAAAALLAALDDPEVAVRRPARGRRGLGRAGSGRARR